MKTDPTKNKHGGNAQSNAAFEHGKTRFARMRLYVLCEITKSDGGATCKDIANAMERGMNAISGRITELKRMGKIKQIGRRDGCAVYVVSEKPLINKG